VSCIRLENRNLMKKNCYRTLSSFFRGESIAGIERKGYCSNLPIQVELFLHT